MKTGKLFGMLALFLAALSITIASAQTSVYKGTVTAADDGQPIIGASVEVVGTNRGTITDIDGKYSIIANEGDQLRFSYLGFQSQVVTLGKNLTVNVALQPDGAVLEENVVVAYGTTRQRGERRRRAEAEDVSYSKVSDMSTTYFAQPSYNDLDAEEYASRRENRFISVSKDPLSTFALEVDGASYSNMRRMVNQGRKPDRDAVRVEEFINYFSYDYEKPSGGDPVKVTYEVGDCAWNGSHKLVRIGVKAREIPSEKLSAANFVFLVDVSGSMWSENRLPLVKSSLKLLVNNLRDEDRVAIVAYAGAAGEVLPSTSGSDKQKIREALDALTAGGSTAGGAGIKLAYKIARQNFIEGGNNRVILATDGDFNVGVSSSEGLESLIEQERKSGVFLTVLGYGMGNYKDEKLQTLAEKGNGNHAYIDNIQEANKVLVSEFGGTMYTVAKDVKLQVEFNPARVQSFRLVGYESRLLEHEDFNDDTKDAGEIGAGHSVTALYEIVPVGSDSRAGSVDPLKYQPQSGVLAENNSTELMTVKLRYKEPDGETSKLIETPVVERRSDKQSDDFYFVSAVAMFAQMLRDSDFKGTGSYAQAIDLARQGLSNDEHGYRREFIRLAEAVKGMAK